MSYDTLVCLLLLLCFYIIASNLFLSYKLIRSYLQKIYLHRTLNDLTASFFNNAAVLWLAAPHPDLAAPHPDLTAPYVRIQLLAALQT